VATKVNFSVGGLAEGAGKRKVIFAAQNEHEGLQLGLILKVSQIVLPEGFLSGSTLRPREEERRSQFVNQRR
jgi:hypothetical protein